MTLQPLNAGQRKRLAGFLEKVAVGVFIATIVSRDMTDLQSTRAMIGVGLCLILAIRLERRTPRSRRNHDRD